MNQFTLTHNFPCSAQTVYNSWLNSEAHSAMTGSVAEISPEVGAEFSAWEGYISGKSILLEAPNRIVQSWRSSEFAETDADSIVKISIEDIAEGCKLTLTHENIPEGQGENYIKGWNDFYFEPMTEYFSK